MRKQSDGSFSSDYLARIHARGNHPFPDNWAIPLPRAVSEVVSEVATPPLCQLFPATRRALMEQPAREEA